VEGAVVAVCETLSWHFRRGTGKNHEKTQGSRSLDQDLNPGPAEYEARVGCF